MKAAADTGDSNDAKNPWAARLFPARPSGSDPDAALSAHEKNMVVEVFDLRLQRNKRISGGIRLSCTIQMFFSTKPILFRTDCGVIRTEEIFYSWETIVSRAEQGWIARKDDGFRARRSCLRRKEDPKARGQYLEVRGEDRNPGGHNRKRCRQQASRGNRSSNPPDKPLTLRDGIGAAQRDVWSVALMLSTDTREMAAGKDCIEHPRHTPESPPSRE
jgi:hypothetical protein